jgi:hypothetical protein
MLGIVRGVVAAALLTCGGCDQVLGLERPEPDCGEAVTLIDDRFDDEGIPCLPWGNKFEDVGTTLVQSNGELQVTPRTAFAAGCTSSTEFAFPREGLLVEVTEVMRVPGAYTSISVGDDDSIQAVNDMLIFATSDSSTKYSMVPFDPEVMRWWKLSIEDSKLTASYSVTGLADWVVLGQRAAPPGPRLTMTVLAGLFAARPDAVGSSRFGRLLLCQ